MRYDIGRSLSENGNMKSVKSIRPSFKEITSKLGSMLIVIGALKDSVSKTKHVQILTNSELELYFDFELSSNSLS